jgi:hypothetical protein
MTITPSPALILESVLPLSWSVSSPTWAIEVRAGWCRRR